MYPIQKARIDVEAGISAAERFGSQTTVITTTTIKDRRLRGLKWEEERDIVLEFAPDFHIPTEYSVYEDMSPPKQGKAIRDCMEGTRWMAEQLRNEHPRVLVQAKGWEEWHLRIVNQTLDKLNRDFVVYYGTGYDSLNELVEDVKRVIAVTGVSALLLIGRQSPHELKKFPPEVVAAAGNRWIQESESESGELLEEKYRQFVQTAEEHLGTGQTTLDSEYPRR